MSAAGYAPSAKLSALSLHRLISTRAEWAPLSIRAALGLVMFPHGAQKAFGWFGGAGLSNTMSYFAEHLGIWAPLTLAVVLIELVGPLLLVCGALTRVAAAGTLVIMVAAVALVHAPHGFFMNWFGTQAGEGYEFHLLAIAMSISLLLSGGGRASVDLQLTRAATTHHKGS
jgi:putative oxidoreductase